jgi:hypothetical protein
MRHAAAPEPAASPERALDVSGAEPVAESVVTRLGGLFHLFYVAQRLGLYGDFATPGAPCIALDVWDFLTLLGRRLLVRPPRDPVWALLAALAGRDPRDLPGGGFAPRTWRVPPAWLEPLPQHGPWRYVENDGRLVLLHPVGFAAVDAPRASLARALRHYGVAAAEPTAEAIAGAPLERWVAHLAAYLRARLAVALGVSPRRAPRLVLVRPARVLVTDTCVDVVSELADLPIEVRLAGLDRDPGHIPAAGRALRFHFE